MQQEIYPIEYISNVFWHPQFAGENMQGEISLATRSSTSFPLVVAILTCCELHFVRGGCGVFGTVPIYSTSMHVSERHLGSSIAMDTLTSE